MGTAIRESPIEIRSRKSSELGMLILLPRNRIILISVIYLDDQNWLGKPER